MSAIFCIKLKCQIGLLKRQTYFRFSVPIVVSFLDVCSQYLISRVSSAIHGHSQLSGHNENLFLILIESNSFSLIQVLFVLHTLGYAILCTVCHKLFELLAGKTVTAKILRTHLSCCQLQKTYGSGYIHTYVWYIYIYIGSILQLLFFT